MEEATQKKEENRKSSTGSVFSVALRIGWLGRLFTTPGIKLQAQPKFMSLGVADPIAAWTTFRFWNNNNRNQLLLDSLVPFFISKKLFWHCAVEIHNAGGSTGGEPRRSPTPTCVLRRCRLALGATSVWSLTSRGDGTQRDRDCDEGRGHILLLYRYWDERIDIVLHFLPSEYCIRVIFLCFKKKRPHYSDAMCWAVPFVGIIPKLISTLFIKNVIAYFGEEPLINHVMLLLYWEGYLFWNIAIYVWENITKYKKRLPQQKSEDGEILHF